MDRDRIKVIFFAPNIRSGGGKTLIMQLLASLANKSNYYILIHEDLKEEVSKYKLNNVTFVSRGFSGRLKAELTLWKLARFRHEIFCFHNLPGLLGLRKNCKVYFHNLNMVTQTHLGKSDKWNLIRSFVEGFLLQLLSFRISCLYCQNKTVAQMLENKIKFFCPTIEIAPFYNLAPENIETNASIDKEFNQKSLIYLADNAPHKNHKCLFEAATILQKKDVDLKIYVTLEKYAFLKFCKSYPNKIIQNLGILSHQESINHLKKADGLIFPSFIESLGLPLIEAELLGKDIIASELDYVRNVCEPKETFDPNSPLSLSRAVVRFYNYRNFGKIKILTANDFVRGFLEGAN